MRKFFWGFFIVLTLCLFGACSTAPREYTTDFFAMDTFMSITVYGSGAEDGAKSAARRVSELERLMSVTDEGSGVYSLNKNGTADVGSDTAELIAFALDISEKTGGALDPTIYPVLRAWGFTTGEYRVPSAGELSELLGSVGWERVRVDGDTVTLAEGTQLDLGAVAKGYAADEAERVLRDNGVTSALINLGGNIQLVGTKPDGSDWRLGLKNPSGEGNIGVLTVSDCAVVTSGNYERCFTAPDGMVYGHIIDPESGLPVDNGLLSMTVIADEGRFCDALSTALFVMGEERALEFWREYGGFDVILVTDDKILVTEGVSEKFTPNGDLAVKTVTEDRLS